MKLSLRRLPLLLLLAAACSAPRADDSDGSDESEIYLADLHGDAVLANATLVDPASRTARRGAVVLEGGVIKEIRPGRISAASLRAASSSSLRVIDLTGKWLLPGLADMHTHLFNGDGSPHGFEEASSQDMASQAQLGNRYLFAGVTTYLDLFSPNDAGDDPSASLGGGSMNTFDLRSRARAEALVHPRSFVAGPLFMVPGSHGVENWAPGDIVRIVVKDAQGQPLAPAAMATLAQSVTARVEHLIDTRHPDVIKFIFDSHEDMPTARPDKMPIAIAKAIIAGAKARNVKTVAHVGSWDAVEQLANAGLSAFTHLPIGAAPPSTIAAIKANDVTAISTMAIYQDYGDMASEPLRARFVANDLFKALVPAGLARAYADFVGYDAPEKDWVSWGAKHNELGSQSAALSSLLSGGIRVLPGSDSGNTGALFGFSITRELIRFEEKGVPRWDVLRAATVEAQAFLGQRSGAIAAGQNADLIAVDADPLLALANLQKVSTVVLKGRVVDRGALDVGPR